MSTQQEDVDTLELTDEGIEMPERLKGYVGQFEIKTPNVTAQFNTTEKGLTTDDYSDAVWGVYPDGGDYHDELDEGEMIIQARGYSAKKYRVIDKRSSNN